MKRTKIHKHSIQEREQAKSEISATQQQLRKR